MNLLGESHQLVRSCKCVPGYRAELGNKVRHIGVGSTAAHGRLINLFLGCGRRLGAAGHEPQPGVDAGELIGGVYQPFHGLDTSKCADQIADTARHRISRGSCCPLLLLLKPERSRFRPCTRGGRVHGCRLRSSGGLYTTRSILHLFCRCVRLLHLLDVLRNCT